MGNELELSGKASPRHPSKGSIPGVIESNHTLDASTIEDDRRPTKKRKTMHPSLPKTLTTNLVPVDKNMVNQVDIHSWLQGITQYKTDSTHHCTLVPNPAKHKAKKPRKPRNTRIHADEKDSNEHPVHRILASREMAISGSAIIEYRLQWHTHPTSRSWEPYSNVYGYCDQLVADFHLTNPEAHGPQDGWEVVRVPNAHLTRTGGAKGRLVKKRPGARMSVASLPGLGWAEQPHEGSDERGSDDECPGTVVTAGHGDPAAIAVEAPTEDSDQRVSNASDCHEDPDADDALLSWQPPQYDPHLDGEIEVEQQQQQLATNPDSQDHDGGPRLCHVHICIKPEHPETKDINVPRNNEG